MIVITVLSFNGAASDGRSALFDELGGSIGRADTNQLVLPDPERSISRVHALVQYRNGQYVLRDQGSNAVLMNGQPLGQGKETVLRDGDEVQIGGYLLSVSAGQKTKAPQDPFADLFGSTPAEPIAAPAPPRVPVSSPAAGSGLAASSPSWPPPHTTSGSSPASASSIPDDWDPFGAPPPSPSPFADTPPAAVDAFATPRHETSLDDLFGLGGGTPTQADPLAKAPGPKGNTGQSSSPDDSLFDGLLGPAPSKAQAVPDHVSELQTPWAAGSLTPAATPTPAAPALPAGAVFSWDHGAQPNQAAATQIIAKRSSASAPTAVGIPAAPAQPPQAPAAMAAAPAAAATSDELLQALRQGLGMPDLPMHQLGPSEMRLIGTLLREAAQGTVDLLVTRNALKRELRAEVTVIAARENNPLKFSPSAEVALQYLLGPAKPGFMAPAAAVHDAFVDLRAHQMGVMAGMRSALEGVLQRFDPTELERRIERRSALAAVLPSSRKAKLWELFQELYQQLSQESSDDFQRLFGQAFLAAYEDCIDQLQQPR